MTGPDHAASGDRHNAYHGGIGASDGQVLTTGGERDGRRPLLLFCVSQRPLRVRLHVFGSMPRLYVAWQRPLMANTEPENGEGKRTRPVAREVVSGSGSAVLGQLVLRQQAPQFSHRQVGTFVIGSLAARDRARLLNGV